MYCRGLQVAGGINLYNATIGSALELNGAVLSNQDGPALRAPGLSVKADMSCGRSFHATNMIDIFGAQIGGQLWLNDARLETGGGDRALNAPQISVVGGLYCNGQFSASGMINLFGAVIGSTLEFNGATLSDAAGMCLRAPGLTVKNSAFFTGCTVRSTWLGPMSAVNYGSPRRYSPTARWICMERRRPAACRACESSWPPPSQRADLCVSSSVPASPPAS
jgi:hypothetical protein